MPEQFLEWLKKSLTDLPRTTKNGLVEIVTLKQHEQFYNTLCK
jgi:hypothetical protein